METQTQIELKLPNGKDYLSPSSSKHLASHPISYLSYAANKFTPNDEMIFGRYYEDILYGVDTDKDYYIIDDNKIVEEAIKEYGKETKSIRSTNVYKDIRASYEAKANGRYILTEEDHERAIKMANIMSDSGIFSSYLDGEAQVTKSAIINTGEYEVKALVRSDVVMKDGSVNDAKTTSSDLSAWLHHSKKMGNDIQAYLSMEVWGLDEFKFIVQRTCGLHEVSVFTIHKDSWYYDSGKRKFNQAVKNYIDWLSPEAKQLGANPECFVSYVDVF
jgi:hypothetical protein